MDRVEYGHAPSVELEHPGPRMAFYWQDNMYLPWGTNGMSIYVEYTPSRSLIGPTLCWIRSCQADAHDILAFD